MAANDLEFDSFGPARGSIKTKLKNVLPLKEGNSVEFSNSSNQKETRKVLKIDSATKEISWEKGLKYEYSDANSTICLKTEDKGKSEKSLEFDANGPAKGGKKTTLKDASLLKVGDFVVFSNSSNQKECRELSKILNKEINWEKELKYDYSASGSTILRIEIPNKIGNQNDRIIFGCKKDWADKVEGDINDLDKLREGITQLVEDYKKGYPELLRTLECIKKDRDTWNDDIKDTDEKREIEDKRSLVDDKIRYFNVIVDMIDTPPELPKDPCKDIDKEPDVNVDLKQAGSDFEKSKSYQTTKQKEYDDLKDTKKNHDETVKKLKDLQSKIIKESNEHKKCFYIVELNEIFEDKILDKNSISEEKVIKSEKLKEKLITAVDELECAKKYFREMEYVKCCVSKKLEAAKKNLEDAKKTRDDDILKLINQIPEPE